MKMKMMMMTVLTCAVLVTAGSGSAQEHEHHRKEHEGHGEHAMTHHTGQHDFSDAERWSKVFDADDRDAWQKPAEVVALLDVAPGMTVADLGAGTGYFLGHLAAAVGDGGKVLGLDVEASLVEFMAERARREGWSNVEARQVPYDDPSLAEGSVDRILTVNTWHHIAERGAYAAKLHRALKPGGSVVVVDLTRDSPCGPPPEERLPPETIAEELAAGGFKTELVAEDLPHQFVIVARP